MVINRSSPHFALYDWWSMGMGLGLIRPSGTMGTLLGIPVFILAHASGSFGCLTMLIIVTMASWYACCRTYQKLGHQDHPCIVSDEVVGMIWTLYAIPISVSSVCMGFVLFRCLDIFKPWPINAIDSAKTLRAHGVMLDDLIAGLIANACMHLIY